MVQRQVGASILAAIAGLYLTASLMDEALSAIADA